MYARTMSPFSASIFLRSRRGWIVIRSQELWRRCVGLRLIASLLSQGRHFAKPRDISRVLVGNRLEPILEDHRWAHRSSRSHLTMIENVKLLRRRSHPTRPRIIQNGPDPRGATRNRDRPAGGVGCTNRLPPRPWDRTTESERADLFFVQRNFGRPPGRSPGLPSFKLKLRDWASKDRAAAEPPAPNCRNGPDQRLPPAAPGPFSWKKGRAGSIHPGELRYPLSESEGCVCRSAPPRPWHPC